MSRIACSRSQRRSSAAVCLKKQVVQDVCMVVLCICYLTLQLFHKGLPLASVWKDQSQPAALNTPSKQKADSPLKEIVERLSWDVDPLSEEERQVLEDMKRWSNLELETMAIADTLVPAGEQGKLALLECLEKNLGGVRGVLGAERADALVSMVREYPYMYSCRELEACGTALSSGEFDSTGSLTTYASLVLLAQDPDPEGDKLHFMLTAVQAEPHLGWRGISRAWGKRSHWKTALARSLTLRVIAEAKGNFKSAS